MKTKLTFTLLLSLASFIGIAQQARFSLALESNVGISDRTVVDNRPNPNISSSVVLDLEKQTFGYDLGLLCSYNINEDLSITAGLKYVSWGFRSENDLLFPDSPESQGTITNRGINNYIEVPIRLSHYFKPAQEGFFITFGFIPSYNIDNRTIINVMFLDGSENEFQLDESWIDRKWNALLELGFGYEKKISQKLAIYIAPNFRVQNFPIAVSVPLNRRLFFYGIATGIKI